MLRSTFLLGLVCSIAYAQELRLSAGAADHQVLQRSDRNVADLKLGGAAANLEGRKIEARITRNGKAVKGLDWAPIATGSGATWTGEIKGIPTGGPYTLELRAQGASPVIVRDLLVGDLWMLAGQSNMEGVGDLVNLQQPDPSVHSFDMADQWVVAKEPLHELPGAADRVHWQRNAQKEPERLTGEALAKFRESRRKGAGLGLPFAVEMVRRTGVPVGLIPCAHGGTSMAQWDPSLRDKGGDSLYGAAYRRFQAVGGRVKGILWYQGESDANPTAAPLFRAKFENLIASFRRDFGQPDLPFYYVQLGRFINNANVREWNQIQEIQRLTESSVPHTGVAAAVDFPLDDAIHVNTQAHKQLGIRLANLALRDLFPDAKPRLKRGPRVVSAQFSGAGSSAVIRVKFSDVNGRLVSDGRISGFSVHGENGDPIPFIYKAQVDSSDPETVILSVQSKLPAGAALHYGYGKDPYCNLRDEANMAALVFGPMPIQP